MHRIVLYACEHGTALSAAASVPNMLHASQSCHGVSSNALVLLGTGLLPCLLKQHVRDPERKRQHLEWQPEMPCRPADEHVTGSLHKARSTVTALLQCAKQCARNKQMIAEPARDSSQKVCCVGKVRAASRHNLTQHQ